MFEVNAEAQRIRLLNFSNDVFNKLDPAATLKH